MLTVLIYIKFLYKATVKHWYSRNCYGFR